jgi:membrane protease YdiL (CAAX protease family)
VTVRRHLLLITTRGLATLVVGIVGPCLVVRSCWWLLDRLPIASPAVHLLTGGMLLVAVARLVFGRQDMTAGALVSTSIVASIAFVGFILLILVTSIPIGMAIGPMGIATLAAAGAEEIVFRRWLPRWLADRNGSSFASSAAAVVVSQAAFSLAHSMSPTFVGARPTEFVLLFVAGLLYQGLANTGGIGMSAAIHGALNLSIATGR